MQRLFFCSWAFGIFLVIRKFPNGPGQSIPWLWDHPAISAAAIDQRSAHSLIAAYAETAPLPFNSSPAAALEQMAFEASCMSRRFAAPRRGELLSGAGASGVITSHGPSRESYRPSRKSRGPAKAMARRPRTRCCLLKGCDQRFHPRQARQRYCSDGCRQAARKWSRWKAQETIPGTQRAKQKRNGQSRRYRERVKSRKPPEPEAVNEAARVITTEYFFDHCCDRPGCYEGFVRLRRSPLQHFCSHDCRRALERVQERERRWKQARDLIRRY